MSSYQLYFGEILKRNKLLSFKLISIKLLLTFSKGISLFMLIPLISNDVSSSLKSNNDSGIFQTSYFNLSNNQIFTLLLLSAFLYVLFNFLHRKIETAFIENEIYKMKSAFIENLKESQWKYLKQRKNAKLLNTFFNDIELIHYGIKNYLYLILVLFQLVIFLIFSFFISWKISLFILILGLPFLLFYKYFQNKIWSNTKEELASKENELFEIQEQFSDLKKFKLAGENFAESLNLNFKKQKTIQNKNAFITASSDIIFEIFAIVIFVALYFVFKFFGIVFLPEVLIFIYLLSRILPLSSYVFSSLLELNKINIYIDNFNQQKENLLKNKDLRTEFLQIENLSADIKFENVFFQYNATKQIFKENTFQIKQGKINAIFGASGVGKTTLIELILGLLELSDGEMLINNISVKNKVPHFSSLTYIAQESHFPNTSLKSYFNQKKEHTEVDIISFIKEIKAFQFLQHLEKKLESELGETGTLFSAGEKQRIALLKMFLDQNDFIILDEASSYLDESSENELFNFLSENKMANQTILFISHTKDLLKFANHVIFLT